MGYDYLNQIIESIGHIALFLVLCLGLIGLPIPNEAVAMTGGALSQAGVLQTALAFLMVWLGICSSMMFNYSIGRFTNSKLSKWFMKKQSFEQNKFIAHATDIIDKYGPFAIPICQFFPFVRHATPYLMGVNNLKLIRFMLFAIPTAFTWTMVYFTLGFYVGDRIPEILKVISRYESIIFVVLAILGALFIYIKVKQRIKRKKESDTHLTS